MCIEDVRQLWSVIVSIVAGNEYEVDLAEAISIAAAHETSAYDAQYVVLSSSMGVPLITEDKRLRQRVAGMTFSITHYLNQGSADGWLF